MVLGVVLFLMVGCSGPLAGKAVETGSGDESTLSVVSQRVNIGDGSGGQRRRAYQWPPVTISFEIPAGMTYQVVEALVSGNDYNPAYENTLTFDNNEVNRLVIPPGPRDGARQVHTLTLSEPLGEGSHTLVIDAVNPGLGQGVDDFSVYYVKLKNE